MSVKSKHMGVLGLAVIVALGVAACGSSASPSGSSSASASARAGTWRIGLEGPLSGSQSALGKGMLDGAQLAADQINANGGIQGRKIEIVPIDDAADPQTGVTAANQAIAGGLNGVVGPYNSAVGAQTLPLYLKAGVVPMRLTSDNSTDGQGFTLQPMTNQIAPVTTDALAKFYKAKSVGILYDSTQNYTKSTSAAVKKQLEAAGIKVTSYLPIKPGLANYIAVLKLVAAKKPDVIYPAVYYPEGAKIATEVKAATQGQANVRCLLDYASYDTGYITDAGVANARNCDVVGVPAPSDFKGSSAYVSQFQSQFGQPPGTWSPYTFDSLNLLADAARKVGSWDSVKLTDFLRTVNGWTGWTGSVTIETATGNRVPATVVVTTVDEKGAFHVSTAWAKAVAAPY
ncbi:MAG: branched-chain amino acid ABC transporter substrate-binding protein [Actinomycetes bacterium]